MYNNEPVIKDYSGAILTQDHVQERIIDLRDLVLADKKLRKFRTDDAYLLRFLHCTDFHVQKAFRRMREFCDLLLEHPNWFASASPLEKKEQIDQCTKAILKARDKSGRRIFVAKIGKVNPSTTTPQEQSQIDEMWFEAVLDEPLTQANGISVIMDMTGYSWKMLSWLSPTAMKISSAKADLYPCNALIHVVNTSFFFNASVKLIWPLLTEKLKKTVRFHFEDWPSLHEYIDPEILPPEYGGTGPEIDFVKSNQWLYARAPVIEKNLRYQKIRK